MKHLLDVWLLLLVVLFLGTGCATPIKKEPVVMESPVFPQEKEIKTFPFAPGSANILAGEKGFVIKGGDFPDEMMAMDFGTEWHSRGLTISDKLNVVLKTKPHEYMITINDAGYEPPNLSIKKGEGLITLIVTNQGTKPHRFGSSAFGSNSTVILNGHDVTLPPPVSKFPVVIVQEGSTINISNEKTYSNFYIEIKPGGTASLTFDGPADDTWNLITMFCNLPGHDEKIVLFGE